MKLGISLVEQLTCTSILTLHVLLLNSIRETEILFCLFCRLVSFHGSVYLGWSEDSELLHLWLMESIYKDFNECSLSFLINEALMKGYRSY